MAAAVYLLCMLTSAFCALLLIREHRRTAARLLLWSGVSFIFWTFNNALVFVDLVVLPGVDLALVRSLAGLAAVSCLLYALVWDAT